jgi:cell division protein FtsI (penicillin-binding protein 3)
MKPRAPRHPQGPQLADPRPPRFEELCALDGERKRALETGYMRLLLGGGLFLVAFLAISLRLLEVGVWDGGAERESTQTPTRDLTVARADILDRNGVLLATSLATESLYADPQRITDPADTAAKLVEILPDLSRAELTAKLSAHSRFVWIKRDLTPRQQYAVNRLGIPALAFQREERRVYPQSSLTAHVVGFTDVDNKGLAGIEGSFDDVLKSGQPVQLSIDIRVQHILHDELQRAIDDFTAIGGAGIVLDVNTGEILAMVSLPDFDPVNAGTATADQRFNRATLGVYEMGSTFKVFNTACALDSGVIGINDTVDASHPLRVAGFTISDFDPENRPLTVSEVLIYSSNIGSALIAQKIGTERQRKFMNSIGMLRRAPIELPEAGAPMYPADWRPINTMTIAYGHGIAVSALHLATGIAAMVDGGIIRPATLIHRNPDQVTDGQRVIKPETSAEIRQLMRLVVQKGTGRKADVPGYFVGGKTGTAEKLGSHGYVANARMASFVGVFPINAPRYVVLAMVDNPKPNATSYGFATGGWVSAPAVGRVIQRMAPLLGIPPQNQEDVPSDATALLVSARGTE